MSDFGFFPRTILQEISNSVCLFHFSNTSNKTSPPFAMFGGAEEMDQFEQFNMFQFLLILGHFHFPVPVPPLLVGKSCLGPSSASVAWQTLGKNVDRKLECQKWIAHSQNMNRSKPTIFRRKNKKYYARKIYFKVGIYAILDEFFLHSSVLLIQNWGGEK
jgi:hypothetical protein